MISASSDALFTSPLIMYEETDMVKIKRNNFRTPQLDFLEVFNLRIKFLQSLERAWNDGVEAFAGFRNYKKDLGGVLIGGLKKRFKRV